jgi:hypothetical protein
MDLVSKPEGLGRLVLEGSRREVAVEGLFAGFRGAFGCFGFRFGRNDHLLSVVTETGGDDY